MPQLHSMYVPATTKSQFTQSLRAGGKHRKASEQTNDLFTLAAFTTLAVATPTGLSARADCNTGPIQCCQTSTTAKDPIVAPILALVGVVLQDLNVGVGLTCSPITVIGGGNGG
ncbi:hypothetical protein PM082_018681 [Marasmius tenuissimus]|nr:hypothetical protein PM082_018681 [Marasmius tenuissimus]